MSQQPKMVDSGDDLLHAVLSLVQEGTPGDMARRALQFLSRVYRCSVIAAFAEQKGSLRILSGYGLDQAGVDAVMAAWATSRRRLLAGERLQGSHTAIVPLTIGEEFAGVLFLRNDAAALPPLAFQQFAPFCDLLAKLCRTPTDTPTATMESLTRNLPAELEREQLVACLEEHEWNLARVARARGVTRPTIYAWMQRLGIERKRVHIATGYALRKRA